MKPAADTRPSLLMTSNLFAAISILIVDHDRRVALLVKKILYGLGCRQIHIVSGGAAAMELMQEQQIDLIITEWDTQQLTGIELSTRLRRDTDSPARFVPIIMLTARSSRAEIAMARDAGITEYLIKPFSARSLLERIYSIIENPRGFVVCKSYVGPDRRRASSMTLPETPEGDQRVIERRPPAIVTRGQLSQFELDDMPRMVLPDHSLKRKLGQGQAAEITSEAAVRQSEEAMQDESAEFMKWILRDVAMLEQSYTLLKDNPDHWARLILAIREAAYSIKARAGLFGYERASEVASLLYGFCQSHYDRENSNHLIILEKHIQTISVIFGQHIKGDGGVVGNMLLKDLAKLIDKYLQRPPESDSA